MGGGASVSRGRIAECYRTYKAAVYEDAGFSLPAAQAIDIRRAFFAGAVGMMSLLTDVPDTLPEADAYIKDLRDELRTFNERVKAGVA
jgi:hypothetical protein